MTFSAILYLYLAVLFFSAYASTSIDLDVCHSESQVIVRRSSTLNQTSARHEAILMNVKLHGNPYHSLHDSAWAVVHYLRNCLAPPYWPSKWSMKNVFLNMEVSFFAELSLCAIEPREDEYDRWKRPLWGSCLIRAVALDMGIPDENIFAGPNYTSTQSFQNTVTFDKKFRPLSYGTAPFFSTAGQEISEQTVPEEITRDTFLHMSQAPFRVYLRNDTVWSKTWSQLQMPRQKLNVLVYDRMDRRPHKLKRKWHSPQTLVQRLQKVERIVVDHRSELPKALPSQAKLFRWADVVLAPHGAAMANTLFMQPGAQIIEINKCCKKEVRLKPESKRDWTGWHADLMQLKLRYVQCHSLNGTLSIKELAAIVQSGQADIGRSCSLQFFQIDDDEAFAALQKVLPHQRKRVGRDRSEKPFKQETVIDVVLSMSALGVIIIWFALGIKGNRGSRAPKFR